MSTHEHEAVLADLKVALRPYKVHVAMPNNHDRKHVTFSYLGTVLELSLHPSSFHPWQYFPEEMKAKFYAFFQSIPPLEVNGKYIPINPIWVNNTQLHLIIGDVEIAMKSSQTIHNPYLTLMKVKNPLLVQMEQDELALSQSIEEQKADLAFNKVLPFRFDTSQSALWVVLVGAPYTLGLTIGLLAAFLVMSVGFSWTAFVAFLIIHLVLATGIYVAAFADRKRRR